MNSKVLLSLECLRAILQVNGENLTENRANRARQTKQAENMKEEKN
jgi:hypothetical protein